MINNTLIVYSRVKVCEIVNFFFFIHRKRLLYCTVINGFRRISFVRCGYNTIRAMSKEIQTQTFHMDEIAVHRS